MNLEEIKARYSEPHRFYHTWDHIEYMFRIARDNGVLINPDSPLWFAIVYHDIIYDPTRTENELFSRNLLYEEEFYKPLNARYNPKGIPGMTPAINPGLEIQLAGDMILMTKNHLTATGEKHLFSIIIDLDLAILGDTPEVYQDYVSKVRKEYAHLTDKEWRKSRASWIKSILDRPFIYYTDWGNTKLEQKARQNLFQELQHIKLTNLAVKNARKMN
jgi:predicted metal-dependent HD superfamily phosphohydrolase